MGSTEAHGFSVDKSGGRQTGSTECNGFDSSKAGGRPIGTAKLRGFERGHICDSIWETLCKGSVRDWRNARF